MTTWAKRSSSQAEWSIDRPKRSSSRAKRSIDRPKRSSSLAKRSSELPKWSSSRAKRSIDRPKASSEQAKASFSRANSFSSSVFAFSSLKIASSSRAKWSLYGATGFSSCFSFLILLLTSITKANFTRLTPLQIKKAKVKSKNNPGDADGETEESIFL